MGQKFDEERFKTQLKLAKCRLDNLLKQHRNTNGGRRREIANLLQSGHEDRARVHVKYLIRDDYLMEAYEMLLTACDDLIQSAGLIARERTLDADLMIPTKSLLYAAGRVEVPELDRIREQLLAKLGKDFGDVNSEVGKTTVDPSLVVKLSIRSPDVRLVSKYLAAIAQIFGVTWTPPPEESLLNEAIPSPTNASNAPTTWSPPLDPTTSRSPLDEYPPPPSYSTATGQSSEPESNQNPASSVPISPEGSTSSNSNGNSNNRSIPDFEELNRRFKALKGER